jgi:hypothetical protein
MGKYITYGQHGRDDDDDDDDDVYLEYYSGRGFHINYSCLHVQRKTHKLDQ